MASSLSCTVYATTVSSASSFKAGNYRKSCAFSAQNPFRLNHLSFPCASDASRRLLPSVCRKLFRVQATVLQDDEEKVVVEESFQSKTIPDDEGKGIHGESSESSSSSGLEKWVIKVEQSINISLTDSVIKILDTLYHDRNYPRFFVLETIARVPYFAFISVLHLYESFGWWRKADYLKVHFAESWNEMHHLLIMEELGGNAWWIDRFLAQHIAVFYYFMTVFMYALSPRMAYHFSECVENHAYETYDKFIKTEGDKLKKLPAPEVAVKYYTGGDLYLFGKFNLPLPTNKMTKRGRGGGGGNSFAFTTFGSLSSKLVDGIYYSFLCPDEFQTSRTPNSRRPKIANLYDVFMNIRDDEGEHCKTMKACQTHGNLRSPHSYQEDTFEEE